MPDLLYPTIASSPEGLVRQFWKPTIPFAAKDSPDRAASDARFVALAIVPIQRRPETKAVVHRGAHRRSLLGEAGL